MTEWQGGGFFSAHFSFLPVSVTPPLLHTHHLMLLLPEGDAGKASKPSNKATALSDSEEHWIDEHCVIVSLQSSTLDVPTQTELHCGVLQACNTSYHIADCRIRSRGVLGGETGGKETTGET